MNKNFILILFFAIIFSEIDFFWDLGIGITDNSTPTPHHEISISTFHRLEGLKKYYSMDYPSAVYHFSQLNFLDRATILYEYVDCYYTTGQFNEALQVLDSYANIELSENVLYLKSKIYCKFNLYGNALSVLNDLINLYPSSEYVNILQFEIEKINLLK
tara:strand:+ start:18967 stop:19443 length:477 start_codon:yes stop_codon:yes gene_type:complete